MIPDVTAQRRAIAAVLETTGTAVIEIAPHMHLPTEFVLIGMPTWTAPESAVCMHTVEWQLLVCVGRSGSNDSLTALKLEGLWPPILAALNDATMTDPTFSGSCLTSSVVNAEFTTAVLQGAEFPCQIITLKLEGVPHV